MTPREPTRARLTPIGHIALEMHTPEEDAKFDLPGEGVVWVHQLYISYALQKGGFGVAAMTQVEALAVKPPMNAKILALDVMSEKDQMSPLGLKLMYEDRGLPTPLVSPTDPKSSGAGIGHWLIIYPYSYQRRAGMPDKGSKYTSIYRRPSSQSPDRGRHMKLIACA